MKKKPQLLLLFLVWVISLSACYFNPTQQNSRTSSPRNISPTPETQQSTHIPVIKPTMNLVSSDYDGVMVITRYYTLSGHRLYEEAYNLLSPSRPNAESLQDFISNHEAVRIKSITLYTIQPYYEWAIKEGYSPAKDKEGQRRFIVWFSAEGEGGMAGAVPNGVIQHPVVTVVQDNGEWRIYSVDTLPLK